jgi:hypothetical protein
VPAGGERRHRSSYTLVVDVDDVLEPDDGVVDGVVDGVESPPMLGQSPVEAVPA